MTGRRAMTGLVLCGGRSGRMGTEKALISIAGRPMVLHVADRLARVADPVLLAMGRRGRLGKLGFPEVDDEAPDAGPLGGLAAGLAASPHRLVAAVGADMPFVSPDVLALLAGLHDGEDAVVPLTDRGPQPLHAVYSTTALPTIREALAEGRLALRAALRGMRIRTVSGRDWKAADPSGRIAANLNRPEDLRLLATEAGSGADQPVP